MNTAAAVRKELKRCIDAIPEKQLEIVRPMLYFLAENQPVVIETDLTAEEKAVVRAGKKERRTAPENFTPWAEIRPASPKEIAMCNERIREYEKNPSSFVPRKKRGA